METTKKRGSATLRKSGLMMFTRNIEVQVDKYIMIFACIRHGTDDFPRTRRGAMKETLNYIMRHGTQSIEDEYGEGEYEKAEEIIDSLFPELKEEVK